MPMSATLFVLVALCSMALGLLLWSLKIWRLAALALVVVALLAIVAEGPHAAAELWGVRVPGIVADTQESARVETARASGSHVAHESIQHRFAARVCYRAEGSPGLGAGTPVDPAIQAAIGEPVSPADRRCREAAGDGVLRQAEVRLDAATFDATPPGTRLTLLQWRPFGLFERVWPADGPLLPFLPRLDLQSGGPTRPVTGEIVAIDPDTRGRTLLSRYARELAVPRALVRLRYALPGHRSPVEGVDIVDLAAVADLKPGMTVPLAIREHAPREPRLVGLERSHRWRNPLGDLLGLAVVLTLLAGGALLYARLRRRRSPP